MNKLEESLKFFKNKIHVISPSKLQRTPLLMSGIFVFLLLVFLSWPEEKQAAPLRAHSKENTVAFTEELQQNLKHLQDMQADVMTLVREKKQDPDSALIRQQAPTSLYDNERSDADQNNKMLSVMPDPDLLHCILTGELIHGVLETAIDSDLSGMTRAVVTSPVYAARGNLILIPSGSRLVGKYQNEILPGQQRLGIIWSEIILPNGGHLKLNALSADVLGRSGQQADVVDPHFWESFGHAAMLSLISARISRESQSSRNEVNNTQTYQDNIADAFQDNAVSSVESPVHAPTIRIRQGAAIDIMVNHDLHFSIAAIHHA